MLPHTTQDIATQATSVSQPFGASLEIILLNVSAAMLFRVHLGAKHTQYPSTQGRNASPQAATHAGFWTAAETCRTQVSSCLL